MRKANGLYSVYFCDDDGGRFGNKDLPLAEALSYAGLNLADRAKRVESEEIAN